jgi:hypothetical protein
MSMTGAPRSFVHVYFHQLPPAMPTAPVEPDHKLSGITGQVREGRPAGVNQKLIETIVASWSKITAQPAKEVLAGLTEINSDMTMEYGLICPTPAARKSGSPSTPTPWTASAAAAGDGEPATDITPDAGASPRQVVPVPT